VKEHGIIMPDDSVRAIIAGTKAQTRQLIQGVTADHHSPVQFFDPHELLFNGTTAGVMIPVLYHVGDRLWVKEAWCLASTECCEDIQDAAGRPRGPGTYEGGEHWWAYYRATDDSIVNVDDETMSPWRSPATMPRWASRLTLEVSEVRTQRLQDISEEDARAEGVDPAVTTRAIYPSNHAARAATSCYRDGYAAAWDRAHAKRRRREYLQIGEQGYAIGRNWRTVADTSVLWAGNPWVWAITFRRVA
jgi:hypothetical protein